MSLVDRFMQKYGRPPTEVDPDYLEMLNMSKYRILDIPDKKQAKCSNCGSTKNDGRKYIDFGLEIDWYGIVFICSLCLTDIAQNAGLFGVPAERIKLLEEHVKVLENLLGAQGDSIESKLSNLMGEVEEYFDALSLLTTRSSSGPPIYNDVVVVQKSDEQTTNTNERTAGEESNGTTESSTSTGSENFSSLTELLKSNS